MNPTHVQANDPIMEPTKAQGISNPILDLNLPIAVRKGVRNCTQHPISHFVSYSKLSLIFRVLFQ